MTELRSEERCRDVFDKCLQLRGFGRRTFTSNQIVVSTWLFCAALSKDVDNSPLSNVEVIDSAVQRKEFSREYIISNVG